MSPDVVEWITKRQLGDTVTRYRHDVPASEPTQTANLVRRRRSSGHRYPYGKRVVNSEAQGS
jgi:hypothetical protein